MKLRKHITISEEMYNYCYKQLPSFNGSFSAFVTYCICFYKDHKDIKPVVQTCEPIETIKDKKHTEDSSKIKSSIESILNM